MVQEILSPLYVNANIGSPVDVFGYVSTASPKTQTDIKVYSPTSPLFYDSAELSGSNTTLDIQDSYIDIGVGTTVGKRILRSTNALSYQNGKAPIALMTGNLLDDEPNVIKRIGLRYNDDFIFLEKEGTDLRLHFGSGSLDAPDNDIVISRSQWDDPVDGTNNSISRANLDLTRNVIFFITFQYLGVGSLFCGFVVNSQRYLVHQFNKGNSEIKPYWRTPNLFLQYEIEKIVAGGNASSLRSICSTLINNDGEGVRQLSLDLTNDNSISLGTANVFRPLIVFRLNPLYQNSRVYLKSIKMLLEGAYTYIARIIKNPDNLSFTPSFTDFANSSIQYQLINNVETLTYSNLEQVIYTEFGSEQFSSTTNNEFPLPAKANSNSDIYVLCIKCLRNGEVHKGSSITLLEEV